MVWALGVVNQSLDFESLFFICFFVLRCLSSRSQSCHWQQLWLCSSLVTFRGGGGNFALV